MPYNFIQPDRFIGKQIILDSDRLLFHGRKDLINVAKEAIVFSSKEYHVNSDDVIKLNSAKLYLGPVENNEDPNNPAVKGKETVEAFGDVIDKFIEFLTVVYPLTTTTPQVGTPSPTNLNNVRDLVSELNELKNSVKKIQSDKIYIK